MKKLLTVNDWIKSHPSCTTPFSTGKKLFFSSSLRRGLHLLRIWVLLLTLESISSPSRLELREMEKTAHFPKHFLIHLFAARFRLSTAQCPRKGFVCHFPRGLDCSMADNRSILPHETIFSVLLNYPKLLSLECFGTMYGNCGYTLSSAEVWIWNLKTR